MPIRAVQAHAKATKQVQVKEKVEISQIDRKKDSVESHTTGEPNE